MSTRKATRSAAIPESLESPWPSGRRVPGSGSDPRKRTKRTLTARGILRLPLGEWTDDVVSGLVLRIRATGKWWAVRYRPRFGSSTGAQRRLHLGAYNGPLSIDLDALGLSNIKAPKALGLTDARLIARALLGLAATGRDPADVLEAKTQTARAAAREQERREAAGSLSVRTLVEKYIEFRTDPKDDPNLEPLRESSVANYQALLRSGLGDLADRDPLTLEAADVRLWHRAVANSGRKVYSNRVLQLVRAALGWAASEGVELIPANPAAGVKDFPERPRQRALSSSELKAIWAALDGELYGDAIRLLLWTGARKSEALGLAWSEVDLAARLLTIPGERSKTKLVRPIPLSKAAAAMLKSRRAADPHGSFVFPGQHRTGPVTTIQAVVERVQKRSGTSGWSLHDTRRTVRTGLSAVGAEHSVSEWVLGHAKRRSKIERTYDTYEPHAEATTALDAWARRLASYTSGQPEGAVVPLLRPTKRNKR